MKLPSDFACPVATGSPSAPIEKSGAKPRIAIFSLTGCEGCSLAILELENQLLDILGAVEIVNFREGKTEREWNIDIGFVDGAVSTPHDEEELKHFRESSKVLVAVGACACLGGINTLKNYQSSAEYRTYVYGEKAICFPTTDARPLSSIVQVDYELPGCPMVREEFVRFVAAILAGRTFRLPNHPVCVECKKSGNRCMYETGQICLGPITRGGCNAICPQYGSRCEGCRGIVSDEALRAFAQNVPAQYDVDVEEIIAGLRLYGAFQKKDLP